MPIGLRNLAIAALCLALAGMIGVAVARPRVVRVLEGLIGGHAAPTHAVNG